MRVDIYERPESDGSKSYLAVHEGRTLPEDATDVEWQTFQTGIEIGDEDDALADLNIDRLSLQMAQKGYAISHARHAP